jgi:hypothetical protein
MNWLICGGKVIDFYDYASSASNEASQALNILR